MKNILPVALGVSLGIALGDVIYQVFRHGVHQIDWERVGVMFIVGALVFPAVSTAVDKLLSPQASASDRLAEVEKMRDKGLLTQIEYDQKRAEIIAKI